MTKQFLVYIEGTKIFWIKGISFESWSKFESMEEENEEREEGGEGKVEKMEELEKSKNKKKKFFFPSTLLLAKNFNTAFH